MSAHRINLCSEHVNKERGLQSPAQGSGSPHRPELPWHTTGTRTGHGRAPLGVPFSQGPMLVPGSSAPSLGPAPGSLGGFSSGVSLQFTEKSFSQCLWAAPVLLSLVTISHASACSSQCHVQAVAMNFSQCFLFKCREGTISIKL